MVLYVTMKDVDQGVLKETLLEGGDLAVHKAEDRESCACLNVTVPGRVSQNSVSLVVA